MAAATASAVTAGLGLGMSAYQAISGASQKRKAKNALQRYKRQELDAPNPYENIPISTVGSDIMAEENQRNSANAVDALRSNGARGVAMIPQIVAVGNRQNQEIRSYLDDQITKRNYAIAGDKTAIRGMKEERENADLAGLGQQMQVGRQDMWSGFRGLASSGMYAANNIDFSGSNPQVSGVESYLKPSGLVSGGNELKLPNYSNILKNYNKI